MSTQRRKLALVLLACAAVCAGWKNAEAAPAEAGRNFNARVLGTVSVQRGAREILVPGAKVYLRPHGTDQEGPSAVTDDNGHYETPPQAPGTYDVCAEAPGLLKTCDRAPVVFTANSPYAVRDLLLAVSGHGVSGRVLLRDNSPCYNPRRGATAPTYATVQLAGSELAARANMRGEYVIGGLPAGNATLTAHCQDGQASRTLQPSATAVEHDETAVDLIIPYARPRVRFIIVRHADGSGARSGRPGEVLAATVDVRDPQKLPLHYRWSASAGEVDDAAGAAARWTLPDAVATGLLTVEVDNGKGGFTEAQLTLRIGPPGERFIGRVLNQGGAAMAGVPVRVDGQETKTDDDGRFVAQVPEAERHVVAVHQVGYAPLSKIFYSSNGAVVLVLRPVIPVTADPKHRVELRDPRGMVRVDLAPNTLVDDQGAAPTGPLDFHLNAFDPNHPEEIPGDGGGRDGQGREVAALMIGGLSLDVADSSGRHYNLAPGKHAHIALAAPTSHGAAAAPATLSLMHYDETAGLWIAAGDLHLRDGSYQGTVDSFSYWSGGTQTGQWSCTQLSLDPQLLGKVRVRSHVGPVNDPNVIYTGAGTVDFVPTSTINAIIHLPQWTELNIELLPMDGPARVIAAQSVSTENAVVELPLEYPYSDIRHGCNSFAYFSRLDVLPAQDWLDQFVGTDDTARKYYEKIDATPAKDTYKKWKAANNITDADESGAVNFYNAQELGLGRKTYCKQSGSDPASATLACCVTKYGEVGGSVQDALQDTIDNTSPGDTVCMEYAPGRHGGERYAKFYIYNSSGKLQTHTLFDPSGDKYVPEVCMHCHGRAEDWTATADGDFGGNFVFLDAASYRYPHGSGPHSLEGQQEKFRQLNEQVLATHDPSDPYAAFIHSLYPGGISHAGSKAHQAPTLPGWSSRPDVFQQVVKPDCRTCHIWQSSVNFSSLDTGDGSLVKARFCSASMPNAFNPMLNIWKTIDPFLGNLLLGAFHQPLCSGVNKPPVVTITAPAAGHIDLGGFGVGFTAKSNDPEDGNNCCSIMWLSDKDGVIGYGHTMSYGFDSPGARKITALATDSDYGTATANINLNLVNEPPTVRFVMPSSNNQSFFKGVPYVLEAQADDPNQLLGVDCSRIKWKSSVASDPFPQNGCFPSVSFASNGPRELTITVADDQGATDTKHRTVNVPDAPMHSPPIVSILSPHDGDRLDPQTALEVQGSAVDPDNSAQVAVTWRIGSAGAPAGTAIGHDLDFDWTPGSSVPFSCGGTSRKLCLYGTDPDGTNSQCIKIYVNYPVC